MPLPAEPHVVVVKPSGALRTYIAYAERVLTNREIARVVLCAQGKAIGKAVTVAEILKRGKELHQVTEVRGGEAEGREVDIRIALAVEKGGVDATHPSYVAPGE